ncbi:MAG: hypothetical protein J2P37_30160, partial [Ktedonobacteraceae bacterium]|nr:hypothetical protein [Ktedonobacteraceae bacterium]
MSVCRSCGRPLHSGASFCSSCGEGQPHPDPFATVDERPTAAFAGSEQATILSKSREQDIISMQNTSLLEDKKLADEGTLLLPADLSTSEEEDEEKRKRRLALLGLAALGEGLSGGGNVTMPVVQGLPQVNQAPVVQGMPQVGSAPGGLGIQSGGSGAQPSLPGNLVDSPPGQAGSLPWRASPPAPGGSPGPH